MVNRKRILVIDDDKINRAVIAGSLESNYDIVEAAGIEQVSALDVEEKKRIDLIIIDMFLKKDDFWEFMKRLKKDKDYAHIPVIVILAPDTDNMFIERAGMLGADEFITRPFSEYVINRRVQKIISAGSTPGISDAAGSRAGDRISAYLEFERLKSEFFLSQTKEIWFEYSFDTSALELSREAAVALELPYIIEKPFENPKVSSFFTSGQHLKIIEELEASSAENTFYEEELQIDTESGKKWFKLSMYILWSAQKNRPLSAFGKLEDINNRYSRLQKLYSSYVKTKQLRAENPDITAEQVLAMIEYFKGMFEIVRLVDPKACMQLEINDGRVSIGKPQRCYTIWNKTSRCENCVSKIAGCTGRPSTRLEFTENKIYNVSASYITVDGKAYALELASPVNYDKMMASDDKNKLLNAITAHNRQLYIDPVTEVYNRRYYDDRLREKNGEFTLAMLDIDNFKLVNDRFGHIAGDEALVAIAKTIKKTVRAGDDVVRFGGDEFLIVLDDMPEEMLPVKLEQILHAVENIRLENYPDMRLTVSIGGAYAHGILSQILRKADMAMYKAKNKRNSICTYSDSI